MSYDPATDKYVPICWDDAFALVGDDPARAGQPARGVVLHLRAAQQRGHLPLPAVGPRVRHEQHARLLQHVPRGERPGADTRPSAPARAPCDLEDWERADLLILMAVNAASNAPRMLTALAEAYRRGARDRARQPADRGRLPAHHRAARLRRDGHLPAPPRPARMNVQPRIGGDLALLRGVAKAVLERRTDPTRSTSSSSSSTPTGSRPTASWSSDTDWDELVHQSGVHRGRSSATWAPSRTSRAAARSSPGAWASPSRSTASTRCARSSTCSCCAATSAAAGAGPSPIRGHSNVQGNRTCGINHHPTEEFLDQARRGRAASRPPREHGLGHGRRPSRRCATATVKVFVSLGGNFVAGRAGHRRPPSPRCAMRADRAGEHQAQPQPPRARPAAR